MVPGPARPPYVTYLIASYSGLSGSGTSHVGRFRRLRALGDQPARHGTRLGALAATARWPAAMLRSAQAEILDLLLALGERRSHRHPRDLLEQRRIRQVDVDRVGAGDRSQVVLSGRQSHDSEVPVRSEDRLANSTRIRRP